LKLNEIKILQNIYLNVITRYSTDIIVSQDYSLGIELNVNTSNNHYTYN